MEKDHKVAQEQPPSEQPVVGWKRVSKDLRALVRWERDIGDRLLRKLGVAPEHWTPADRRLTFLWITVGLVIVVIAASGYEFEWKWTGVTERTFWDWLSLLIVPFVLALGGYMFTRSESRRTKQQTDSDREIALKQANLDREIAFGQRQDEALQAYLDGMSPLLIDQKPPLDAVKKDSHLSTVARAWTLTVLETLTVPDTFAVDLQKKVRRDSGRRKRRIVRFLYEANLIGKKEDNAERIAAIVDLSRASLVDADLSGATLRGVDLSGADLGQADLHETDLRDANLEDVRQRSKGSAYKSLIGLTDKELVEKGPILTGATMPSGHKYDVWRTTPDKATEKTGGNPNP